MPEPTQPADPPASPAVGKADELLGRLTAALGESGEERPGQHEMTAAIAEAIDADRHVVVQAGTGTGKSLAYLAATAALRRTTVVATATKALQDQLADKELPFVAEHLGRPLRWAVLKGRSNYLCLQRLDEAGGTGGQLGLDIEGSLPEAQLEAMRVWATETDTGDRADLPTEPAPEVWAAVSVGPLECPGAAKCPRGADCFAEAARARAAEADVIVVNTHLYGLHLATGLVVLPEHSVVVFDEAHEVADIISATTGRELTGGRFEHVARIVGGLVADDGVVDAIRRAGDRLADELGPLVGTRLRHGPPETVADVLVAARQKLADATAATRAIEHPSAEVATRIARLQTAVGALTLDIDAVLTPAADTVTWVDGDERRPRLATAPLRVAATLGQLLWNYAPAGLALGDDEPEGPAAPTTVVLTSATIPAGIVGELGIPPDEVDVIDVGSPFDFEHQALLYCAAHLPDPRQPAYLDEMVAELERLIRVAKGRTLALFTSFRVMDAAADALSGALPYRVLRQGERPKPALVEAFSSDESSCLFATMGFWQGIDVPGPALSMVTLDRIPFPRPDEPLLQARREAAGAAAFREIDLARAATLLAQGAGRLIRSRDDRGVVAVLDSRLATGKSYRWDLVSALPPMRRTKDIDDVRAFFRQ